MHDVYKKTNEHEKKAGPKTCFLDMTHIRLFCIYLPGDCLVFTGVAV